MSTSVKDISSLALGLPARSRALLADLLLDSLDEGSPESFEAAWTELARSRDAQLDNDPAVGRTHAEVMAAADEALRCLR